MNHAMVLVRGAVFASALTASLPAVAMVGGATPAGGGAGRAVVMLTGSHGTFCSGVALAPSLVLTAGHCVLPGADYKLIEFDAARRPALKDISAIARHPEFDVNAVLRHQVTADVAVLRLATPSNVAAATLAPAGGAVAVGDRFTVVGYGLAVRGDGKSGGTVRAATLAATGQPGSLQIRLVDPATRGERAGLARRHQRGGAHGAASAAIAAHRHAEPGDGEFIARGDHAIGVRQRRHGEGRRKRRGELEKRHVGSGAVGEKRRETELRMPRDGRDILELRLVRRIEDDELVVGARQHAMRRRQHDIARDHHAAARVATRPHEQRHVGRDIGSGRRRAADHGEERAAHRSDGEAQGERGAMRDPAQWTIEDHGCDQPRTAGHVKRVTLWPCASGQSHRPAFRVRPTPITPWCGLGQCDLDHAFKVARSVKLRERG